MIISNITEANRGSTREKRELDITASSRIYLKIFRSTTIVMCIDIEIK